ncbi:MAG: DUF924 domain-containing protein [Bdellovibrionales bacterium]|nr:DUF924 domain-containing protein [Bdellovibrionales bacterium]
MHFQEVIDFWFSDAVKEKQFDKDPAFDLLIKQRFSNIHGLAHEGKLVEWREEPLGRLAEVIVLDQFSRNMFRDTPQAFASDALALSLALSAIELGVDQELEIEQRAFLYMPLMHSESQDVHEKALLLFSQEGLENSYKFELMHKEIIDRFGRYPHRNKILGRTSTEEEIEFLQKPNSSF